jgi:TPR repeat protein
MSYCHQDVKEGIRLLRQAASAGYVRASYALGLALRDTEPETAQKYMKAAADDGYIPALQELLPPRKMKEMYGEPKADELRLHLDPICLNRLLTRYYVVSAELRDLNTSHCWNPLCGRWAFKANAQPHNDPAMDAVLSPTRVSTFHTHGAHNHYNLDSTAKKEDLDPKVSRMK